MSVKRKDLLIPYGASDFRRIRNEGYYYVDKTQYLARMEERGPKMIRCEQISEKNRSLFSPHYDYACPKAPDGYMGVDSYANGRAYDWIKVENRLPDRIYIYVQVHDAKERKWHGDSVWKWERFLFS